MTRPIALLLTVKPQFAERIFVGTKKVELRRLKPRISIGDQVLVYTSSPTKAITGAFEVKDVLSGSPDFLWREVGPKTGMDKKEFDRYFAGADYGHAIFLGHVWRLPESIPLTLLREMLPGFHPPRSHRYLSKDEIDRLGGKYPMILSSNGKAPQVSQGLYCYDI